MSDEHIGMDPEMKRYFRKIVSSFSLGLLWMLSISTAGLYFGLALFREGIRWYNLLFYALFFLSLAALLRYFYRVWKD